MGDTVDRRSFLKFVAGGLAVGVAVALPGCGGSSDDGDDGGTPTTPPTTPPPTYTDEAGKIGTNHGHMVTLTAAQQQAGVAVTLVMEGTSDHSHTLSLSATDVQKVASGEYVSRTSSFDDGHSHEVVFS